MEPRTLCSLRLRVCPTGLPVERGVGPRSRICTCMWVEVTCRMQYFQISDVPGVVLLGEIPVAVFL